MKHRWTLKRQNLKSFDYVLLWKRHRKVTLQTNLLCEGFINM